MPFNNGDLGADERDAITADLLLKKLRAGLDKSPKKTEENTKLEASHISDEAMKQALSEIVYGNLEEYESDKLNSESLSKYVDIIDDGEEDVEVPVGDATDETVDEAFEQDDDPWFEDEQPSDEIKKYAEQTLEIMNWQKNVQTRRMLSKVVAKIIKLNYR